MNDGEEANEREHASPTLTRMGERVSALEERTRTLKEDTAIIRSTIHDVNSKLQQFIILGQQTDSSLKNLAHLMSVNGDKLNNLTDTKQQMVGVWWAIVRVCAVVVGAIGVLASIVAFAGWMLEHHVELVVK